MKTLTQILFSIIVSTLLVLPATAQVSPKVQSLFYQGYLSADKALWTQAIKTIENASLEEIDELEAVTEAQTGLLICALAHQDQALYDEVADPLESNLEALLEHDETDARSLAKLANLNSTTMAFQRWKAMYLSPTNEKLVERALEANPKSPEAWMQRGGALYFTPETFGGDVDQAIVAFQKAVTYYEAQPNYTKNWRYLDALAWLGQAYQKADRPAEATKTFQQALKIEPDFGWVKYQLLPQVTAQTLEK